MIREFTATEIATELRDRFGVDAIFQVNNWLARGDGIAVYENHDLGHPDAGAWKPVSYGSPSAQLETGDPPRTLPDIGGQINWRYQLIGTYRGGQL